MKKVLSLVLALSTLFVLCACSSSGNSEEAVLEPARNTEGPAVEYEEISEETETRESLYAELSDAVEKSTFANAMKFGDSIRYEIASVRTSGEYISKQYKSIDIEKNEGSYSVMYTDCDPEYMNSDHIEMRVFYISTDDFIRYLGHVQLQDTEAPELGGRPDYDAFLENFKHYTDNNYYSYGCVEKYDVALNSGCGEIGCASVLNSLIYNDTASYTIFREGEELPDSCISAENEPGRKTYTFTLDDITFCYSFSEEKQLITEWSIDYNGYLTEEYRLNFGTDSMAGVGNKMAEIIDGYKYKLIINDETRFSGKGKPYKGKEIDPSDYAGASLVLLVNLPDIYRSEWYTPQSNTGFALERLKELYVKYSAKGLRILVAIEANEDISNDFPDYPFLVYAAGHSLAGTDITNNIHSFEEYCAMGFDGNGNCVIPYISASGYYYLLNGVEAAVEAYYGA